ncbi:peptidoglycan-binding protein [Methylovorus menthalis]|uniref:FimV/HubP family polar landmark protein n=1 Tax=Methylovorus menthalis TaxID=1002227 RepID=UPI001E5ED307|nr:FimV/HubP family polar landmark protein [Methylovorus menthalis]MCB4811558.1 peptidoglycan-binding protein [Methylovorus menthalis]
MHKSKLKRISLAVCLAMMPWAADAAGLGRLTVASGLGEPLSAEIELLGTTPDELESLSAAIAPEAAYAVQGVERSPIQNAIQINISRKSNGTAVLKLSSNQPITDPFVDMLIQVEWATGRLVREYTMLLDPPGYATPNPNSNLPQAVAPATGASQPASQSPIASGAVQSGSNSSNASTPNISKPNSRKPAAAINKPKPLESDGTGQTHTTSRGDTLSAIARNVDAEGISLDQMLVGIYRANKSAFADNNMNRLKVGQILRIPPAHEVQDISNAEARQEIQLQAADWNAYRKRLGESVATSAAGREGEGSQSASGKLTSAAQDKAAQSQSGSRDVVRLSKGDAPDGAAARSAQEKLNTLQEEAIAKEKALQEANERAAALEKQVQDMQKLLAIKNQAMAVLKDNAAAQLQPNSHDADQKVEPDSRQVPAESTQSVKTDKNAVKPEEKAPARVEPKSAVTPASVPVPAAELIDGVDNEKLMLWGGAGAALLLLLGGWLYLRNKRKRNLDTFEKAILTSSGLKANTVFGSTLSSKVDSGDTSFLTDFSQTGGGMIDTHDVDPIAEAEVYMAYGRDAQAEEILRDAIAKDPKRYELHHKLLEMYAARKDTSAFETLAGEIYATIGASDPQWRKVAELGRKLDGQNPIYQGGEDGLGLDDDLGLDDVPSRANADIASAMDFSLDDNLDEETFSTADPLVDTSSDLDFGLGDDKPAETSVAADDSNALDFVGFDVNATDQDDDLGNRKGGLEGALAAESMMAPTIIDELPERYSADDQVGASADSQNSDSNDIDFQLDLPESPAASTIQMDIGDFGNTLPGLPEEDEGLTSETAKGALPSGFDLNLPMSETDNGDFPDLDLSASTSFEPESKPLDVADEKEVVFGTSDAVFDEAEPVNSFISETPFSEPNERIPDVSLDFDTPFGAEDKSIPNSEIESAANLPDAFNEDPVEEIVFESPTNSDVDLDFNLDSLSSADEDDALPDLNASDSEPITPAEVDFSDISLDLNGTAEEPLPEAIAAESAEVDTKLDLVTAYMDMGDNEGAKELLDEVLSEGGPQQRARAQAIMNSLGA